MLKEILVMEPEHYIQVARLTNIIRLTNDLGQSQPLQQLRFATPHITANTFRRQ